MIGNNEQAIDKNLPSSNKEGVNEGNSKENQKISEAMNVMKIAMTPTTPKAMDFNGNGSSTRPPHRRALTAPGYLETEAEKPKESRTPSPNHSTLRRTTPERSNNNRPTSMPGTPYVRPRTITALSSVTESDVNQLPCRLRNQRPASFHEIRDRGITSLHATRPQRPRSLCDPSALPKEGSTDLRRMVLSTPATPISPLVSPTSPEDGAVSPVYSEPGGPNILRRKKTLKERLSWPGLW